MCIFIADADCRHEVAEGLGRSSVPFSHVSTKTNTGNAGCRVLATTLYSR